MKPKVTPKKPVRRRKRPRTKSSPPVKKPRKPLPVRQRFRRAIIPAVLICCGVLYGVFYVVDRRVTERLISLSTPKLPVIYSSPLDITEVARRVGDEAGQGLKILRTSLVDRRYSEVAGNPSRPGEFSLSSKTLTIYSRSYSSANGDMVPARKDSIPLGPGDSDARHLFLEPQVISYLGSADVRAS